MPNFDKEIASDLKALREAGLWRELREVESPQGREILLNSRALLNFSSNDYLGLANTCELKEAAAKATHDFGAGTGASRLVCGSLKPHRDLEDALSRFEGTEAALAFSTGYAAALGTIQALIGPNDISVIDKLVHASVVDGVKLSGAKMRVFRHNDLDSLAEILVWADHENLARTKKARVLIITESIFSMDGDRAPLREIVALKERNGAWLMVDEAHGTGLYGSHRRGVIEELGLSKRIEVHMGTLGKALGAAGGFICGSRPLVDCLINKARSFIFSTAPVPAAVAAARAGVELVRSEEGQRRCALLWKRVKQATHEIGSLVSVPKGSGAIIPLIIGSEAAAVEASTRLREQGCFIPAIRYPAVPRGKARLRMTLTAEHTEEDVKNLARLMREQGREKLEAGMPSP